MSSPYALEAIRRYASGENATPAQIDISRGVALRLIGLWEWQYNEYLAGMLQLQELPVASWRRWYRGEAEYPLPVEEIWQRRKDIMNPDFVQFMDENVLDGR